MVFPIVPPRSTSPRAQELGQRVALTIAEFQQRYPDLSDEEVRHALALAADHSPEGARPARGVLIAVAAGAAAALGLGAFLAGGRLPYGTGTLLPALVAVGVALLAVVVARRRRE